jgi:hypothetical protein
MGNVPILRLERRARRMHEMADCLQVDRRALARLRNGAAYAEARSRCLFCGTSDTCLRWLDDARDSGKRPTFCPNLQLFEACKRATAADPGAAATRLPPPLVPA